MLPIIDLRAEPHRLDDVVRRPVDAVDGARDAVRGIIAEVRAGGDAALCALTERFDGASLTPGTLRATPDELARAWDEVGEEVRAALTAAAARIRAYHDHDVAPHVYDADGVTVTERTLPVAAAGVYVPGGRAEYPSTVLMTVLPAQAAGVARIALCVPPRPDGTLPTSTAAAAHLCGVDEVYKVGGAQAIAALAYGTETVAAVDVVVGPGNIYVALAKAEVRDVVGVESLAGPSECVVVADPDAPLDLVAVDMITQAEHGPGGFALLVTWSEDLARAAAARIDEVVAASPRRAEIESTFAAGAHIVLVDDAEAAIDVANAAAAEHLQLLVADPEPLVGRVRNAGAVFCGYDTPVPLGDYAAGPSHVLPTGGTARFASALRPDDFRRSVHVVTATPHGIATVGPVVVALAEAEGLDAHAESVRVRLADRGSG
jgi:histidinol dehydrogenase